MPFGIDPNTVLWLTFAPSCALLVVLLIITWPRRSAAPWPPHLAIEIQPLDRSPHADREGL